LDRGLWTADRSINVSDQSTGRTAGRNAPRFGRDEQELLTAIVLLGLFLYLRFNLADFVTGRRGAGFVDPDFWPGLLIDFIIVMTLLYGFQVYRRRAAGLDPSEIPDVASRVATSEESASEALHEVAISGDLKRLVLGFFLLWLYIYSMTRIGFLPSTFLFSIVFLRFVGEKRPLVLAAIPVTIVGSILVVFTRLLVVPLPRGTGFFLELSTRFY